MASNPTYDPNQFVERHPDADVGRRSTTRATTTRWSTGPIAGQYAPGSTFKLVTVDRRAAGRRRSAPTKTIDDKGQYAYPTDPERFFTNDNGARYGRVDLPRAITVSSDVYFYTIGGDLYYRQRHDIPGGDALQDTARQYGFGKATGIGAPERGDRARPRRGVEAEDPRRQPGRVPVPRLAAGRQHPLRGRPGRHARDAVAARERVRLVRERRDRPRAAARVRGARREGQQGARPRRRSASARSRCRHATRCWRASPASPRPKGGTAVNVFQGFPAGMVAGKTGTAQVQGKQPTSLFVGMTPGREPEVHRAGGRRGGRLRGRDLGSDRPADHAGPQQPSADRRHHPPAGGRQLMPRGAT